MTWGRRRQVAYALGVLFFTISVSGLVVYRSFDTTPTCFDTKRNGNETGVDCGGSCLQYCPNELQPPKVRWSRSFEISPGVYHAVAYIEHNNPDAGVRRAPYVFRLFNDQNTLVAERTGETFIGPAGRTAIVETLIQTNGLTPVLTRLSFPEPLVWEKINPLYGRVVIKTDKTFLEQYAGGARLTTVLENTSRVAFTSVPVVALLHDSSDNTVAVSLSVTEALGARDEKTLTFTWPFQIDPTTIVRTEIIPRINPFTAKTL